MAKQRSVTAQKGDATHAISSRAEVSRRQPSVHRDRHSDMPTLDLLACWRDGAPNDNQRSAELDV